MSLFRVAIKNNLKIGWMCIESFSLTINTSVFIFLHSCSQVLATNEEDWSTYVGGRTSQEEMQLYYLCLYIEDENLVKRSLCHASSNAFEKLFVIQLSDTRKEVDLCRNPYRLLFGCLLISTVFSTTACQYIIQFKMVS